MSSILALRAYGSDSNDSGEDEGALTAHLKPLASSEGSARVKTLQVCSAPTVAPKVNLLFFSEKC